MGIKHRFFSAIARLDFERPWLVLIVCAGLAIASMVYTRAKLEFRTGQDDLISASNRDSRNYLRYTSEFPDLDGLIVAVRADKNPDRAERFADTLDARLARDKDDVKSIFYKIDPGMFAGRELLYLSVPELKELASHVRDYREFLASYASDPTLQNFFALANAEANRAMMSEMVGGLFGPSGKDKSPPADTSKLDLGFIDAMLGGMLASNGAHAPSPWDRLTSVGQQSAVLRDGYLASDNGKYLLMYIAPGDGRKDGPDPVDAIQSEIDSVRAQFPGIQAGMTGGPALSRAEEGSTAHDIGLASILAIASNVLLVVIPFGGIVEPAFALAALLVGVTWSFGFTTLAVGHLNLLSAVFTSVLAGIGINFPIHLMARYDEARRAGRATRESIELGVVNTGSGVVASACIMALAFLMPMFSDFKGIAELGLVSAAGLFLCLVSAMFVFPAMVAIRDRKRPPRAVPQIRPSGSDSWLKWLYARPGWIVGGTIALTLAAAVTVRNVGFDQNLLKLQAESTEAVQFEQILLKDSGRSSWFAVSLAKTRAGAEKKAEAFRKLPEVSDAETIATYIPDSQAEKRAILASMAPIVAPIRVAPLAHPSDPAALQRELEALSFKLEGARKEDPSGAVAHTADLLAEAIARLKSDPKTFDAYEARTASALGSRLDRFKASLAPDAVTEANLPKVMHERFIGTSGAYLVQIYPRGDVWDDAPLTRFVTALRTVDPNVTGPPVQTWAIATVMRVGYERAAVLALIAVFVFVFADFRSLRDTALATVPLVFGGAWLLEAMGLLGWEFNLANLFAVPIIIGTGVDNGVNMLYRWREERDKSKLILTTAVGKSVTIASLTTIAGFAALIPATHRGISGLGWVLSLGVFFILIATLVVLPAMFELIGRGMKRAEEAQAPVEPVVVEPRRAAGARRSGMLAILAACALILGGARMSRAANAAARTESNRIVAQAETMIEQAGHASPVDSVKVRAAVDKLHQALKVDPDNDAAYVDLGFCYGLLHDGATATDMYMKAVKINPSAANYKELSDIYMRVGDPEHALMAANAGLLKAPTDARLWNAKGMALNDLQRLDEAADAFQKALKYDPSLTVARSNLKAVNSGPAGRGSISKQTGSH